MDTLIYSGDHYLDARGVPVTVQGHREIIQRALIRLQVKKGAFPQDPGLGSELYRLRRSASQANQRLALSYVQEALAPLAGVKVESVTCTPTGLDSLQVAVAVRVEEVSYQLEVKVEQ